MYIDIGEYLLGSYIIVLTPPPLKKHPPGDTCICIY